MKTGTLIILILIVFTVILLVISCSQPLMEKSEIDLIRAKLDGSRAD